MRYIDSLIDFINKNDNWIDQLSAAPYNLTIKEDPLHHNYYMFKYVMFLSDFNYDEVKASRGCVLDIDGNKVNGIVCHPFDKFFNYGEPHQDNIDWSTAIVTEKIDGQLIKISRYHGDILYFTNGAFGLNTEISCDISYDELVKSLIDPTLLNRLPEGWTIMFEFISPYNRIICKYNEPKLYLLGARDNTGQEWTAIDVKNELGLNYDTPRIYDLHDINAVQTELEKWNGLEQEGVVICDSNFNRIKIKCDDYLKIKYYLGENKVITDDRIFQAILANEIDDLIAFDSSIAPMIEKIEQQINEYYDLSKILSTYAKNVFHDKMNCNRKKFANWALSDNVLNTRWFALLDDKSKKLSAMSYDMFLDELDMFKFISSNIK